MAVAITLSSRRQGEHNGTMVEAVHFGHGPERSKMDEDDIQEDSPSLEEWIETIPTELLSQKIDFWISEINSAFQKVEASGHRLYALPSGGQAAIKKEPTLGSLLAVAEPLQVHFNKLPRHIRRKTAEVWIDQLEKIKFSEMRGRELKPAKHYDAGLVEGERWARSAKYQLLDNAVKRLTINEEIIFHDSKGSISLMDLGDDALIAIHTSSPMISGDYPEIIDFFEEKFTQGEDYGYQVEKFVEKYHSWVNIPNEYFRAYEDGWMDAVRQHMDFLFATAPWSPKMHF